MTMSKLLGAAVLAGALCASAACKKKEVSLKDDAGGRTPEQLPEIVADVFQPMDGGIELTPEEIKGRNTWNLWTAGTEQFWDRMARESYGLIDLLKTIDSRQRGTRFKELGLINQPGFKQASKPDEYGLWLDEPVDPANPEPAGIDEAVYGRPSGILGFRLFPNPDFDAAARKKWDADRYYNDPDYAVDKSLVRPYRVGISCGSCHIAPHPLNPPADPENPNWDNLASAIGNQYIHEGRVFAGNVKPGGFFWEMINTQPRGTSDTSRIATDNINNPNTINALFLLAAREGIHHQEDVVGESLLLPGDEGPAPEPRILKDGADSIGVFGATARVYVNIGSFSQHFLAQHNPLVGLKGQQPFSIKTAQENSVFWRATEQKIGNIAQFFRRLRPWHLADAPGGAAYLTADEAVMGRGRLAFAQNCATCHSSKQPPDGVEAREWFAQEIMKPDFLEGNFLSDEKRYPLTKIQTNAARALGTNAKRGNVWHHFSSETYKSLPSIGDIEVWNPYTERDEKFTAEGGGPGYYRTPSLVSLWTSAPYFHNNALGKYTGDPSVAGRVEAFQDAMEKMLWPEKRLNHESIWRTSQESQLQLQAAVIPQPLRRLLKPHMDPDGYFRIGHIPAGTPVNLIANINPDADPKDIARVAIRLKKAFLEIKARNLDEAGRKALLKTEIAPLLFQMSKCPDLVTDRGHYYGEDLPDEDKLALIEFLKTL